jgi:hypothetical protein
MRNFWMKFLDGISDPLRWVSENGHDRVVEILLKDPRVDPYVAEFKEQASLMHASRQGHIARKF